MRWVLVLIIFIFCFVGLETYRSTEVMKASYTVQKLKSTRNDLEKANGYLKQRLSSSLSLDSLENRARGNLGFISPQEVRFLGEEIASGNPIDTSLWRGIWEEVTNKVDALRDFLP